eukprot:CAMPEP_0194077014 /NCGR_PEP_ID=MMETSP0149-20130528/3707_1 /TAXON_ID=122233 /ORGANISM="Chaetoceros debilis, Strain MM31A-1" /LENGTH=684 /DNA_ID=CAMNT_0038757907 /DNA_START=64 /DNA_END=2118 /DNA_ORIENTATION=-
MNVNGRSLQIGNNFVMNSTASSSDDQVELISREKKNCEDGEDEETSSPRSLEVNSDANDVTTRIIQDPGLLANINQDRGCLTDGGEQYQLEEDIFSMIFLAPYFSPSFVYAMLVFGVQMTILVLALINLLKDPDTDGNTLNIPPYIPGEVFFAQFFAILISLFVSDDVVASLDVFLVNYDKDIQGKLPGATFVKWILSNLFRFLEGMLGILVAFVFIVQSEDVLYLFLDFSAVQFVSELDNVGYYIADKGYISFSGVEELTESMKDVKMRQVNNQRTAKKSMKRRKMLQLLVFYLTMVGLYSVWGVMKVSQLKGNFYEHECQKFMIKLPTRKKYMFFNKCRNGEQSCPESWKSRESSLQYTDFNGLYEKMVDTDGNIELYNNRPLYRQISSKGNPDFGLNSPPGIIKYCEQLESWVFSIKGVSKGANANDCSWLVKSPETEVLTLNHVPEGDWQVWTGAIVEGDVDITCVECKDTERADGQTFDVGCNYHGECNSDKTCTCEEGFAGTTCSMCSGCTRFKFEDRVNEDDLGAMLNSQYPGNFKRLDKDDGHPLELYDNLVYYHAIKKDGEWIAADPLFTFFYWGDQYVLWNLQYAVHIFGDRRKNLIEFFETFHSAWDFQKEKSEPRYVSQDTDDRWDQTPLKWRLFTEYEKNSDFSIGQYHELAFRCVEEEATFDQCPYRQNV